MGNSHQLKIICGKCLEAALLDFNLDKFLNFFIFLGAVFLIGILKQRVYEASAAFVLHSARYLGNFFLI